ncbi:MAG: GntR family transcriptional regulator, transcriptional repressor for pyruvate dehydrogenase complex [Pseudonocardiales bacterium]|jgi:DNA-binding FadR family transcriptional regulator|nr:GntR family transcriptional regulator, transcriptional repressor for pyruvate dehydrogenase complex [Pseudonocardiales bacterium]MDQ1752131.1 GntR family transcriptional regulator, transcriptional repressor for pyruvate dehydrogenase complex [Pseudonocardiales bacterium]
MSLTEDAITKIKQMILDGRLKAGDRLPREADLADELGISRGSLREAVRALSLVRILDVRQGDGTYVTSLQADVLMEAMAFLVDFHQDASVLQLFEVRRVLEPAASQLAASAMSEADARDLVAFAGSVGSEPSVEELVQNDIEFHHRIAEASGNPVLCSLIDSLSRPTQRARVWRGLTQGDSRTRTLAEHHAIADAILRRQPALAHAWATVHVAGVEEWLRQALAS